MARQSVRAVAAFCIAGSVWAASSSIAAAQEAAEEERVWVQVEALSSLSSAEARVRAYSQLLDNVNGYRTASGRYIVALGPFDPETAQELLSELQPQGMIPSDSYIEDGDIYASQFFPIGDNTLEPEASGAQSADQSQDEVTEIASEAGSSDVATPQAAEENATADEEPVVAATDDAATEGTEAAAPSTAPATDVAEAPAEQPVAEGETAEEQPSEEVVAAEDAADADEVVEVVETPAEPEIPEETVQEARRSEANLSREERDELQIALQWFGYYTARIDGAFGPGTRRAMTAFQEGRDMEPTGVLTTRQRAQLLDEYASEVAALGMETIVEERAGIEIDLPMAMIEFADYNFPFAQFDSRDESGVEVLLISQPGNRSTLLGLYEIMQTLEIVPLEGERERRNDSFLLTGQSDDLRSHTEARLVGGNVKGFTLVWAPERDEQMARVLPMMQESFRALDGALDPAAIPDELDPSIDMVSGLTIRQPEWVRSGFFLNESGDVLTSIEQVDQCQRILLDNVYEAEISASDAALGFAVLSPSQTLAPLSHARLVDGAARLRGEVAVAGYPFDGALSAASTTFGTLAELTGMNDEPTIQRLEANTRDSETGGPVLDLSGNVIGMVLPGTVDGRRLPDEVTLALRSDALLVPLQEAGITVSLGEAAGAMNRENLSREAADITIRVSCWN